MSSSGAPSASTREVAAAPDAKTTLAASVPPAWRTVHVLALTGCLALHLLLTLHFAPLDVILSHEPITGGDYSTHAEQTFHVLEGLQSAGQSWLYDPRFLAGFPNGTVFDADNKAWEMFTFALSELGMHQGLAFNLFALMVFLLVPITLAASARVFGLSPSASVFAALLATLLFFFDSFLHWLFFVGTIAFVFAAYLSTLALALFSRFLQARSLHDLAWLTILLSAIHLVHPYAFFVLAPPMLFALWRSRRTLARRELVLLLAMGGCVILSNTFWIVPALQHFHYILDSSYLMSADVRQLALDYFELLSDVSVTGVISNHTGFRVLVFGLACAAFVLEKRAAGVALPALAMLRTALLWLLALAYLGDHIEPLKQIQPYRFLVPAIFFAIIPASHALACFIEQRVSSELSTRARVFAGVALVVVAQHLASEALYFFPNALPRVRWFLDIGSAPITATGFAAHPDYRLKKAPPGNAQLAKFMDAHKDEGRFAVQDAALGEELAWRSQAHILGGFWFCNLRHSRANLFRRLLEGPMTHAQIEQHLIAYDIRYVVLSYPEPSLENDTALFTREAEIGGHKIYKTRVATSWFALNSGTLRTEPNRLSVQGSDPTQDLVLRFHMHEALVCTSGCTRALTTYPNETGGVPFIRVPAPHAADVVIENSYRM